MVRISTVIFIIFFLLFNIKLYAKNPPPGTGTSDIPANILIMLDNSGSMRDLLPVKAGLIYPIDVQTDSSGNIFVLEYGYGRMKAFDSSGNYLRDFGGVGGPNNCTRWNGARQFAIYNDQIYIADFFNRRIKVLDLEGNCIKNVTTNLYPHGIAVNDNYIFYSNYTRQIGKLDRNNFSDLGYQSFGASRVSLGFGMSLNNAGNKLVVANAHSRYGGRRFTEFNVSGSNLSFARSSPRDRVSFDADYDSNGNIFGTVTHSLRKYNSSLSYLSQVASGYSYPYGVHLDSSDNSYVADFRRNRLIKYNNAGTLQFQIGGGRAKKRLDAAKDVIRKIVSNTDLTSGANFGLMQWGSNNKRRTNMIVPISENGARQIFNQVRRVRHSGGTEPEYALAEANRYWAGQKMLSKQQFPIPPNYGQECTQNYIIFISDGQWNNNHKVINELNDLRTKDKGKLVKTFMVGFALTGSQSNYISTAVAGGTTAPLFADNEADLLATLTDAIKQAISGRLTFTTPAVMSDVQKGDFVYQATFEYANNKQWEGSVKKYQLNENGTFGATQWDAAETLNNRTSSRRIWTAGLSNSNLNNFTTTNRDEIRALIYPQSSPSDTEIDNLINFIRGVDTYDQDGDGDTSDNIHKLADIYHSNLIVVGPPEASTAVSAVSNFDKTDAYYRVQNNYENFKASNDCGVSCSNREEVIIAGANNGILHLFKTDNNANGEELWGFIPPAIMENLSRIPSAKANATNPIYGLDSSPVVKDIFFDDTPNDNINNPRWRTILLSGFGAGGSGFFALDITNLEDPRQIFSIKNDPINKVITHWDSDSSINDFSYSSGTINPEFDYRKLGETWSTPRIIRIKVDSSNDGQDNPTDKWVAVFGGGYNGTVNPDIGSAVFVVDIENEGRVLKVIDIEDKKESAYAWPGSLFKRTTTLVEDPSTNDENRFFTVSSQVSYTDKDPDFGTVPGWNDNVCYDPNKNEIITAEFTPAVSHTIAFKDVGNLVCVDYVEFDEPWPNTRNGGPPKPDTGNVTFRRLGNDVVNGLPADLNVITADGTGKATYNGALIYANDLEGKITKINLTENYSIDFNSSSPSYLTIKENISTTTLFDAETTASNGRYIYTKSSATINNDNNLWLYFGTGNTQKLREDSDQIQNRLFGIKDKDFPNFVNVSQVGNISKCTNSQCPVPSDKLGWYVNLVNKQKLTAEPTVDKDRVYFPIYEPSKGANSCTTGKAILTAYDTLCGSSLLNIELGSGVLSKVVVQGDNLYIGIAGNAKDNISGFTATDNLITGKSQATSTGGAVQNQYWKEID